MPRSKVNLAELRIRAERALAAARSSMPMNAHDTLCAEAPTHSTLQRLVEELRIYQTELEIQNQELAQSQMEQMRASTKYQALFAGLPLPVLLCDTQGFIVETNHSATQFLGLRETSIRQSYSFVQLIDLGNRAIVQSALFDPPESTRPFARQVRIEPGGGQQISCEVRVLRLSPDDSGITLNLVVLVDKTLEVQLALQTTALARAKESAETANEAKNLFLAKMSHELRTPLNGILGLSGILKKSATDPWLADRLSRIHKAGEHLLEVINDILDFSKIQAGKLTLENVVFSPMDILADAMALIKPQASSKKLDLIYDIDHDVPQQLRGDPLRIRQALLNYLHNAVKFTTTGNIAIHVQLEQRRYNEALVRFAVRDTGAGIDEPIRQHLFQPFVQGDNSLTRRHGGSGLGLAIVRQLAILMGGDAGVSSTLGAGSTFWFTAKLACPALIDAPMSPATASVEDALECLRSEFPGTRVLVCESDWLHREIAAESLADASQWVATASDGAEALACTRGERFDVLLLDMQMAAMNALTLTQTLRRQLDYVRVPIIALTDNDNASEHQACRDAGMNAILIKPLNLNLLYSTLLQLLRNQIEPE